jgi:hypothetical protein
MQKPFSFVERKGFLHFYEQDGVYSSFNTSTGLVAEALMIW